MIFRDNQAREKLEAIVHPEMVEWIRRRLAELRQASRPPEIVVLEAAILTHMGLRPLVDAVVRMGATPEVCLARLQERDGISRDEARTRLAVHEAMGLFGEAADYVLDTSGTLEQTRAEVKRVWGELVAKAEG